MTAAMPQSVVEAIERYGERVLACGLTEDTVDAAYDALLAAISEAIEQARTDEREAVRDRNIAADKADRLATALAASEARVIELQRAVHELFSNPHLDLGDLVYKVRESEGEGWDGPAVKAWSAAVANAKKLLP